MRFVRKVTAERKCVVKGERSSERRDRHKINEKVCV
jgi:hypothetical protein